MKNYIAGKPQEFPKPDRKPELPGKDIPEAPSLPPEKPDIIPDEKPKTDRPPTEVPEPDKRNSFY